MSTKVRRKTKGGGFWGYNLRPDEEIFLEPHRVPGDLTRGSGVRLLVSVRGDPLHRHLRPLHHPPAGAGDGSHPLRHRGG